MIFNKGAQLAKTVFQRGPQFRPLLLKLTILIICKCDVVFSKRKSGNTRK